MALALTTGVLQPGNYVVKLDLVTPPASAPSTLVIGTYSLSTGAAHSSRFADLRAAFRAGASGYGEEFGYIVTVAGALLFDATGTWGVGNTLTATAGSGGGVYESV